jgi:hypothetical protein
MKVSGYLHAPAVLLLLCPLNCVGPRDSVGTMSNRKIIFSRLEMEPRSAILLSVTTLTEMFLLICTTR